MHSRDSFRLSGSSDLVSRRQLSWPHDVKRNLIVVKGLRLTILQSLQLRADRLIQ
jgi:hypothetical protein